MIIMYVIFIFTTNSFMDVMTYPFPKFEAIFSNFN